jgi:putative ABC transport system permease protein
MFMSVLLFISASSFCDYLTHAVDVVANDVGYDIKTNISWNTERDTEFLLDIENAKKSAYCGKTSADVYISDDMLDPAYIKAFTGKFVHNVSVVFVDDENYQMLVTENKLRNNGGAVIINQHRYYDENRRVTVFPVVNEKKTGDRITVSVPKDIDGYYYSYFDGTAFNYFEKTDGNIQQQMELPFEEALTDVELDVAGFIDRRPFFVENNELVAIYPVSKMPKEYGVGEAFYVTDDFSACQKELEEALTNKSIGYSIHNNAEENATNRAIATVINVFSYGFIILISLIALANVFNTVTTNIYLRRRELAMIKAVGITSGGFNRMMNYECVICGARSLAYALPASVAVTYLIYLAANSGFGTDFYMPFYSVAVAVLSVFVIVFVSMLYSMHKLKKENIIETLKNENI